MTEAKDHPRPIEDKDNAEFLAGWRRGKLMLQQSEEGGPFFFYPRPLCPHSWSSRLIWKEASGRGRILSYALVYRPNHPSFADDVPIILAEIELEEGAGLLGRIICDDPSRICSGLHLEILPMPEAARYPLPTFRLAAKP